MARVSGLVSGLDTDSLIQELVSAYETKKETYVKKQTKQEWTIDAWKSMNTKVYGYYTGTLRNARFTTNYNAKKATVSDSTKATVSASGTAVAGTQTLKISQLAKTAYLTGGKITDSTGKNASYTANNTLSDLGFKGAGSIEVKVKQNGTETAKQISVDESMTINQFVTKLKETGLNASFDVTNQRLFVSSSSSGADNEFSITANDEGGIHALKNLGLNAVSTSDVSNYLNIANTLDVTKETQKDYINDLMNQATNQLNEKKTKLSEDLNKLTEERKQILQDINDLNDKLKYVQAKNGTTEEAAAYVAKVDKELNDAIQTYQDKIKELSDKNTELMEKTSDDNTTVKVSDFLNNDGSFQDKYYKTDENGTKVLDEDALTEALEGKFKLADMKSWAATISSNNAAITENTEKKTKTEAKQKAFQAEGVTKESVQKEIYDKNDELKNKDDDIETKNSEIIQAVKDIEEVVAKNKADVKEALEQIEGGTFQPSNGFSLASSVDDASSVITYDATSDTYKKYETFYQNKKKMACDELKNMYEKLDATTKGSLNSDIDWSDSTQVVVGLQEAIDDGTISAATLAAAGAESGGNAAVRVEGSDAVIELNGAQFTSNTNNFSINGLTITATGITSGDGITISTTTDIDGMYDSIKKMLSGYNEVLKEMNTHYYADSAKGYNPLSDDEKDAMTDTEIEKWETKIKDSLLRRDDTLGSIMNVMKNSMAKSYTINGKSYSLSSFGIKTAGYFSVDNEEQGLYHIDGDSEDSTSSGNEDKLRAALATDPDTVVQFFQKLSDDLYEQLTKKMARTSLKSSYTIYNDKQMQKQYEDYDDIIDKWDEKIETYTERYVKQFSAMEKALSQLQSSTSSLSNILG